MDSSEFGCISWGMHKCILKQSAYFVPWPHYHASNECVWRSKGRDTKKCISCHGHIPSIIFHAICGAYPFILWRLWEYMYLILLSSSNRKYDLPLFRGRSWNNGMRSMSLYILTANGFTHRAVWISGQNYFVCNSWFLIYICIWSFPRHYYFDVVSGISHHPSPQIKTLQKDYRI